ncbi:MAG: class I SAM-dependent methyltransferase [Candidatus Wallbacteria bacterium]|nr:class I SAM-dependent methyltransferase [Candidatus Wallbacteria bacterium]
MDIEALDRSLAALEAHADTAWIEALGHRKRDELEFHDRRRDRTREASPGESVTQKLHAALDLFRASASSSAYLESWIARRAPGKVFLDYACGEGSNAIRAARAGAKLAIGIDISRVSIENARRDAERAGLASSTRFLQADAENTQLPDGSVEIVVCSGVLHHLDLAAGFSELRRILAPGGRILAVEALGYNPAIRLYRKLTPARRTRWEEDHILTLADLELAQGWFTLGEVRYWHIAGLLAALARPLLPALDALDSVLTRIPFVQLAAWIFTFELLKTQGEA